MEAVFFFFYHKRAAELKKAVINRGPDTKTKYRYVV